MHLQVKQPKDLNQLLRVCAEISGSNGGNQADEAAKLCNDEEVILTEHFK